MRARLNSSRNPLKGRPLKRAQRLFVSMMSTSLGIFFMAGGGKADQAASPGFWGGLAAPEAEVLLALHEVLEDHIIHGTRVFEREPTLTGAEEAPSSPLFPPWEGGGKVFYKVRNEVIAPRHFKESSDLGTIAVRYVVIGVNPERTRMRIDAVFVES